MRATAVFPDKVNSYTFYATLFFALLPVRDRAAHAGERPVKERDDGNVTRVCAFMVSIKPSVHHPKSNGQTSVG